MVLLLSDCGIERTHQNAEKKSKLIILHGHERSLDLKHY
jgi:hypothetical protein